MERLKQFMLATLTIVFVPQYAISRMTYGPGEANRATWADGILREEREIKNIAVCALLCKQEAMCSLFHLDGYNQICQLARHTPGSCVKQSDGLDSIEVYEQTSIQLRKGETAQTYLVTNISEKSYWEANQVLPVYRTIDRDGAHRAIDGVHPTGPPLYHSSDYEDQEAFPWIQIKLDREHWVKGGVIHSRDTWPNRQQYKEIRVGNTDISESSANEVLCRNQLCYRTGADISAVLQFDCATPLKGQLVTIQKYDHYNEKIFEMLEVDIEVYCGPFLNDEGKTCVINEEDSCKRKITATKNTDLADTAADKSAWIVSSSSIYYVASHGFTLSPSYIKDGVKSGSPINPNLFHTKMHDTDGDTFPWLQIDFTQVKLVKAVHLYSRTDVWVGKQIKWSEVRVGNIDAAAIAPLGTRFCVNELCKTTGAFESESNTEDCSAPPLRGRYVTVQRMKYEENPSDVTLQALSIAEVDVMFYI